MGEGGHGQETPERHRSDGEPGGYGPEPVHRRADTGPLASRHRLGSLASRQETRLLTHPRLARNGFALDAFDPSGDAGPRLKPGRLRP